MKDIKFIQLISAPMSATGGLGGGLPGSFWSNIYALDDDGRVWMWSGAAWMQLGPHPQKPAPAESV